MRPTHARHLLGFLLSLALAGPAAARPSHWYAVEVVVFAWNDPVGRLSEHWPEEPGLPLVEGAVEPGGLGPVAAGEVAALAPGSDTLGAEAWPRLERARETRPVLRRGWIQAPLGPEAATRVRIRGGVPEAPWLAPPAVGPGADVGATAAGDPLAPPLAAPSPLTAEETGAPYVPPEAVDGTVQVTLSRYLHVRVDLAYRGALPERKLDPLTGAETLRERRQVFRLVERRRVRLGEVHYFDHPAFGVLVQVRRIPCPPGARCVEKR